jgi:thiol-disulfide isomerase/thioredoxin
MFLIRRYCTVITLFAVSGIVHGDERPVEVVIEGRVVDSQRAPIVGALVMLRPSTSVPFVEEASARTDAEGRYRIGMPKATAGISKLQASVLAVGFKVAVGSVETGPTRVTADFTLEAQAWKTTEVIVADSSGGPSAGVELACSVGRNIAWSLHGTDAAGGCRIEMATGQPMTLQVRARRARPIVANLMSESGDSTAIRLRLLPPIRGRVRNTAGQPVPQVTVGRSITVLQGKPGVHPHRGGAVATTDADGLFELAPPVLLTERQLQGGDRYRAPATICFADRELKHLAFKVDDWSKDIGPLEVVLEPSRLIRVPIEFNSAPSPVAVHLSFSIPPRPDCPDFDPVVLFKPLDGQELTGSKSVEVMLPKGKYRLNLVCYTEGGTRLGEASQEITVDAGQTPVSLPPVRLIPAPHQKLVGKPAPELDATHRDTGKSATLHDFRGKVVILDFWGYWCGPCNGAMPYLADLHRRYKGRPLAIVALHDQSVQTRADYDRRTEFAQRSHWGGHELPFDVLFDRPDPNKPQDRAPEGTGVTCKRYEISGFPTLFVIDQRGTIVATLMGDEHARLEALINKLLDQRPTAAAGG